MNDLRQAAQQALETMEKATRFMSDSDYRKLNESIDALKEALVEDAMQRFSEVNQELEAALAEDVVTHGNAWSKDGKRIDPMSVYAEPVQEPAELPLEEALSKAYYYTEDGRWRGPDVRDWDRWHAVAKVAVALTRRAALAEPVQHLVDPAEYDDFGAAERYNRGLK